MNQDTTQHSGFRCPSWDPVLPLAVYEPEQEELVSNHNRLRRGDRAPSFARARLSYRVDDDDDDDGSACGQCCQIRPLRDLDLKGP